jgi:hypothetical protein
MAASRETIARQVLQNLGISTKVTSISNPQTAEEKSIAAVYETERDYVLADFPWPFATEFITLGAPDGDPADPVNTDWTFAYPIPEGYVTLRRLVPPEGRLCDRKIPHRIGRYVDRMVIFTDEIDAVAELTITIIDENLFDSHFIAALAWRIAGRIAPAHTKIKDAVVVCNNAYMFELGRAGVRALAEEQPDAEPESDFTRSRY